MTERVLSDRDKAALIDRWTTRVRELVSWTEVPSLPERVVREVVEDAPGVAPARAIDSWQPIAIRIAWKPRLLSHAARVDIQAKGVAGIRRAETWEAALRTVARVVVAAAKAYGGAA